MAKSLLLIPTDAERRWAGELLEQLSTEVTVAVCGFGAIVAGIRTAQLIGQLRPQHVWLAGIAGAIDPRLQLGAACEFEQVSCYGVGAGSDINFQTATEMGWQHWPGDTAAGPTQPIGDTLELTAASSPSTAEPRELLTACAASADAADVACRQQKFPLAQAEDMEGFAVAAACQLAQVPLRIMRGLANVAGDRDQRNWQSEAAMRAAVALVLAALKEKE